MRTLLEKVGVVVVPEDYDQVLSGLIEEENAAFSSMMEAEFYLGCEVQYWGMLASDPRVFEIKVPSVVRCVEHLAARQSVYERANERRRAYQACWGRS